MRDKFLVYILITIGFISWLGIMYFSLWLANEVNAAFVNRFILQH